MFLFHFSLAKDDVVRDRRETNGKGLFLGSASRLLVGQDEVIVVIPLELPCWTVQLQDIYIYKARRTTRAQEIDSSSSTFLPPPPEKSRPYIVSLSFPHDTPPDVIFRHSPIDSDENRFPL